MPEKILLVEDDGKMLDVMRRCLENRGFSVLCADNGARALMLARDFRPDLVVADVQVPGMDGCCLCKAIKCSAETAAMPVIIISGVKIEEADIVSGYDKGADDYLTKPFALPVLAAKINAVLRRYSAGSASSAAKIREQGLELDPVAGTVKLEGKPAALTRKEFGLLSLLIKKKEGF